MKQPVSRRSFLRSPLAIALATSTFPSVVSRQVLGRGGATPPSERVTVAAIGVGPQGQGVMGGILARPNARVVAVCDVMERHRAQARKRVNDHYRTTDCAVHADYRDVLARNDIDAVMVATPDHWHVPISYAAAKSGKDVYLEKPMGMSLAEDQKLREAVQAGKRVFQFGTQQRSSREFQRAIELVRNGRIGKLRHIDVWAPASRPGGSMVPTRAPADLGLDYESWLGPVAWSPYTDGRAADRPASGAWKTWWYHADFALGFIAGWGVHPLDIALWGHPAMMSGPMTIRGSGIVPTAGAGNTAVAWDLSFAFADGVTMRYKGTPNEYGERHGLNDFSDWTAKYGRIEGHGTAFVGTEGWVEVHRGGLRTSPERLMEEAIPEGGFRVRKSDSHQGDWIDSILLRRPAVCSIEESVQADLLCHVSDIAVRIGSELKFDPVAERFEGNSEANAKLALRPVRPGWEWV